MRGKCWRRTDHSLGQVLWCSGNHDDDIIEITKKPASCGQILRSPAMSSFIILILITLIIINILMIIRCDQILRRPARSLVPGIVSSVSGARGALAKMWECFLFFILLLWLVRFVFFIALVESNGPLESEKSNIKMKWCIYCKHCLFVFPQRCKKSCRHHIYLWNCKLPVPFMWCV